MNIINKESSSDIHEEYVVPIETYYNNLKTEILLN